MPSTASGFHPTPITTSAAVQAAAVAQAVVDMAQTQPLRVVLAVLPALAAAPMPEAVAMAEPAAPAEAGALMAVPARLERPAMAATGLAVRRERVAPLAGLPAIISMPSRRGRSTPMSIRRPGLFGGVMADVIKTEQTLLTGSIPAIAGIEDPSQARMILYQAGRPVHAPMDRVGLATNADVQAGLTAETRSRIVNGAFQHSQENGSTAGTTTGYYVADEWMVIWNSTGTFTCQRVQSVTPNGSKNRIRTTVTVADAALAATDVLRFQTRIEGIRMVDFCYGSASARQSILRFGFKAPAGTYSISLYNSSASRSYLANFTISVEQADTDTEQVFVIPGDTTGTWLTDTGVGVNLNIVLATGTTYQGVAGWQATGLFGTAFNTNGMATVNNTFELFDVGLYLDPLATGIAPPWVMPDEAEELAACQRYWEGVGMTISTSADMTNTSWFRSKKRAAPALALTAGTAGGATFGVIALSPADGVRQIAASSGLSDGFIVANARM